MAFNFPNSPTLGQQVPNTASGQTFTWTGVSWDTSPVTGSQAITASFAQTASILTTRPTAEFRRTQVLNLPLTTDTLIQWNVADVATIPQLSTPSGQIINDSTRTRTFIFDFQCGAKLTNTGFTINEHNIFLTKNGLPNQTNRVAEFVIQPVNSAFAVHRLSAVVTMAPNDIIRCYEYVTATGATTWISSGNEFGYASDYSTRLKITEI